MKKLTFLFLLNSVFSLPFFSQNSAESLLSGFLENDLTLKKNVLSMQSKAVSLDSERISSGVSFSLSTGNVKITTSGSKTKIKMEPAAEISVPQAFDTSLSADIPIVIEGEDKTVTDGTLSLGVGILSASSKKKKASLLEAQKAYDDALLAVKKRVVQQENEFYTQLKSLYKDVVTIFTKMSDRYDDAQNLEVLAAKNYRADSAAFMNAKIKVDDDDFAIEEAITKLSAEAEIFAKKCGVTLQCEDDEIKAILSKILAFLPDSIPEIATVQIEDFYAEDFSDLKEAKVTHEINEMKREAENAMTLRASAVFTLNDSFSKSDSAGGKLTWKWNGILLGAGVFFPTGSNLTSENVTDYNENPYFTFSASLSLSDILLASKTREQNKIKSQIEEIAIEDMRLFYEDECVSKNARLRTILWNEKIYDEKYKAYTAHSQKIEDLLKNGLAKEIDLQQAQNNAEKARINILVNRIDKILCVNETKILFDMGE